MTRSHSRLPHFEEAGGRHREDAPLPPLRESDAPALAFHNTGRSSVLPISGRGGGVSTGASAVSTSLGASRRGGGDLGAVPFEQARNSEGKLALGTASVSGASRTSLRKAESSHGFEDPRLACSELESLKRQVARLTQLRKDRDVYIQDLLADAETMQKRHEGELTRRTAKAQKQFDDEREDLRRAMRSECDREAERLRRGVQEVTEVLLERAAELEAAGGSAPSSPLKSKVEQAENGDLGAADDQPITMDSIVAGSGLSSSSTSQPLTSKTRPRPEPPPTSTDKEQWLAGRCIQEQTNNLEEAAECALQGARDALGRLLSAAASVQQQRMEACDNAQCAAPDEDPEVLALRRRLEESEGQCLEWKRRCMRALAAASGLADAASPVPAETCNADRVPSAPRKAALLTKMLFLREWSAISRQSAHRSANLGHLMRRRTEDVANDCHILFFMWKAVVASEKAEALALAEVKGLIQATQNQLTALSWRLRDRGYRAARAVMYRELTQAMLCWMAAIRERKKETAHRYQLITAAADASAEQYQMRAEARKVATELRRQRRAHGVAAIHASLDRRLQAVLHAWCQVSRETQREANFQRQLDISAAESAASCAVLRMEFRRNSAELREQRRTHARHSIDAGIRHVQHAVFYAWCCVVTESNREVAYMHRLSLATSETATVRAESRIQEAEVSKWQRAHASAVRLIQDVHWLNAAFSAWACLKEAAEQEDICSREQRSICEAAVREAEVLESRTDDCRAAFPLFIVFNAWHLTSMAQKGSEKELENLRQEVCEASGAERRRLALSHGQAMVAAIDREWQFYIMISWRQVTKTALPQAAQAHLPAALEAQACLAEQNSVLDDKAVVESLAETQQREAAAELAAVEAESYQHEEARQLREAAVVAAASLSQAAAAAELRNELRPDQAQIADLHAEL